MQLYLPNKHIAKKHWRFYSAFKLHGNASWRQSFNVSKTTAVPYHFARRETQWVYGCRSCASVLVCRPISCKNSLQPLMISSVF